MPRRMQRCCCSRCSSRVCRYSLAHNERMIIPGLGPTHPLDDFKLRAQSQEERAPPRLLAAAAWGAEVNQRLHERCCLWHQRLDGPDGVVGKATNVLWNQVQQQMTDARTTSNFVCRVFNWVCLPLPLPLQLPPTLCWHTRCSRSNRSTCPAPLPASVSSCASVPRPPETSGVGDAEVGDVVVLAGMWCLSVVDHGALHHTSVICCCTWFQSTLVALPTTPSGPSSR